MTAVLAKLVVAAAMFAASGAEFYTAHSYPYRIIIGAVFLLLGVWSWTFIWEDIRKLVINEDEMAA